MRPPKIFCGHCKHEQELYGTREAKGATRYTYRCKCGDYSKVLVEESGEYYVYLFDALGRLIRQENGIYEKDKRSVQ